MEVLDYERVIDIDAGNTIGYYADGHVDKEQFAKTILDEEGDEIPIDEIKHGYMLKYDLYEDDCTDYANCRLDFQTKQRTGWEPVTFWGDL
jgi:hypothetical protein